MELVINSPDIPTNLLGNKQTNGSGLGHHTPSTIPTQTHRTQHHISKELEYVENNEETKEEEEASADRTYQTLPMEVVTLVGEDISELIHVPPLGTPLTPPSSCNFCETSLCTIVWTSKDKQKEMSTDGKEYKVREENITPISIRVENPPSYLVSH